MLLACHNAGPVPRLDRIGRLGRVAVPSLAAGLLVAFSVPPWAFWPLAFPGIALLMWRLRGLRARSRALAGLLFGFGLFGPTLFWISEFHAVGYVALLVLEGSFFAAAAMLTPPRRSAALAAFPAAYVLAEVARGIVPFGGLPMGGLPLGQVTGPLAPVARLGGAYLLTGMAVAVGAAIVAIASRHWRGAVALIAVPAIAAAVGFVSPNGSGGGAHDPIRVAIVQGGGPRGFRAVDSVPGQVLRNHLAVSEGLRAGLDLVLWPENTIDVDAIDGSPEADELSALAQRIGTTVVAGVTENAGIDNFQNVSVVWSPEGEIVDRYIKAHRVPFGEYVPLRSLLSRFADLSVLPRDAVAGKGPGILRTPAGDFGVAISYEVFFSERGRAAARAGGEVLLVPTNAASFTSSQVPTQEIAAAQLRAEETGRWVVMSAPTGYGAVIDAQARVHQRTTLSRPEILVADVQPRTGRTVYVVLGDLPVVTLAIVVLVLAWSADVLSVRRPRLRRRRPITSSPPDHS